LLLSIAHVGFQPLVNSISIAFIDKSIDNALLFHCFSIDKMTEKEIEIKNCDLILYPSPVRRRNTRTWAVCVRDRSG